MLKTMRENHPLAMDFVVSQPLERCAYRLALVEERREIPFVPRLTLYLCRVDADTYVFELHEDHALPISIQGVLNRLDQNRTYVSGRVRLDQPRMVAEQSAVLLMTLACALLIGPLMVCISLPLLCLLLGRYQQATTDEFGRLIHLLRGTLA
jgi:hypothetical protein